MIADTLHRHLIDTAEAYCRTHRISMVTLSLKVVRSGGLFERLDCGGSLTIRNYGRFMDFFRDEGFPVKPVRIGGWPTRKATRAAHRQGEATL